MIAQLRHAFLFGAMSTAKDRAVFFNPEPDNAARDPPHLIFGEQLWSMHWVGASIMPNAARI